jgi:hypothetical protein
MEPNKTLQAAYKAGARESSKIRDCDDWDCACTLTYWDRRNAAKNKEWRLAFGDGWSDAATGDRQYWSVYFVKLEA